MKKIRMASSRGKKKEEHIEIIIRTKDKRGIKELERGLKRMAHKWSRKKEKEISYEVVTIIENSI